MKIAIATDAWHPQISGVVTTLSKTIEALKVLGHRVLCIHPGIFKPTLSCPTYPQIRLAVAPCHRTRRLLNQFDPDCIHVVTEGPIGLACRRYCENHRLSFTTAFTTRFDEYISLRSGIPSKHIFRLLRWFHSASSRVMVSSEALRKELGQKGIARTALWPRGVDTNLFRIRDKSFLSDPRPIFMSVGRVAVEKNIEDFLSLNLPGTKYVVGDGPARHRLEAKYPEAKFVGAKTGVELARFFAASDVFVFPSRTDTFGIVVLEALACGVPVAAYPVRGPADIVQQGVTGYLDNNLREAALHALNINGHDCRNYAMKYSWENSIQHFIRNLVSARQQAPRI